LPLPIHSPRFIDFVDRPGEREADQGVAVFQAFTDPTTGVKMAGEWRNSQTIVAVIAVVPPSGRSKIEVKRHVSTSDTPLR
jgi:hypothetical protein